MLDGPLIHKAYVILWIIEDKDTINTKIVMKEDKDRYLFRSLPTKRYVE